MRTAPAILCVVLLSVPGCAGTEARPVAKGGAEIDAGRYVVCVPPGDWEYSLDTPAAFVQFQRSHTWLGRVEGISTIEVITHRAPGNMDEGAVARSHLDMAELLLCELARGEYTLTELERCDTRTSGRGLPSITWRKRMDFLKYGFWREHGVIRLWFPPDFGERRIFYSFAMTEGYLAGSVVATDDLLQLDRVMESFVPKDNPGAHTAFERAVYCRGAGMMYKFAAK